MIVNNYTTAKKTRNESFSSSQYKAFSIYRGHIFNATPKGHTITRLSGRQVQNLKFFLPYYCRTVCNNVIYWTAFYRKSTVPGVWGIPGTKQKYSLTADKYNFQHKFYWTPYGATMFALSTICCPIYAPSCRPDITLMQAYSCPNNCVHMHIEVINKTIINNSWNTIHIDKFKHYANTGTITLPVAPFLTVL